MFARSAVGLLEQAYSGSPLLSFLPLYYAVLNLSKIFIVASGRLIALERNRLHGVVYNPKRKLSHDFLTEQLLIKNAGVFPLFYETLTGSRPKSNRRVLLEHLVPYLRGVSHEYHHAYRKVPPFQNIVVRTDRVGERFRLHALCKAPLHDLTANRSVFKVLVGFKKAADGTFHSPLVAADSEQAAADSLAQKYLRRELLADIVLDRNFVGTSCMTPLSSRHLLMIEEIPIWLTLFALSNVVRYNPEFLDRLQDSKAWPLLLCLRKHVMLRFLILTWSFLHKTNFHVVQQ